MRIKDNTISGMVLVAILVVFFISVSISVSLSTPLMANIFPEKVVNSLKASLYQEADLSSKLLVEVTRGETLQFVRSKGLWSEVIYNNKITGWVYSMLIVDELPKKEKSNLSEMDDISTNQRARASLYSRSAAARGLADAKDQLEGRYPPDYQAIQKMERFSVTQKRAFDFINERNK